MLKRIYTLYMIFPKSLLSSLYGSDVNVGNFTKRVEKLRSIINGICPNDSPIHVFPVPGRADLVGSHTDHQKGRAIAAALSLDTLALIKKRDDLWLNVYSDGFTPVHVNLSSLEKEELEIGSAPSLARGVAAALDMSGRKIGGADIVSNSIIPRARGLSSSAAFEVLIGSVLSFLYNDECLSASDIAKAGWWAENNYYEKPCGILDQSASATGGIIEFDGGYGANGKSTKLPSSFIGKDYSLIITNTGPEHSDLTEPYSAIINDMKKVASFFSKKLLSEVKEDEFFSSLLDVLESLKDDRAVLRAIHYFDESKRVSEMRCALSKNNIKEFLRIINASGDSSEELLQNTFVSSTPNEQSIPLALGITKRFIREHGGATRMQGGGFAGCIQTFVLKKYKKDYIALMESYFSKNAAKEVFIREEKAGYIGTLKA